MRQEPSEIQTLEAFDRLDLDLDEIEGQIGPDDIAELEAMLDQF